MSDAFEEVEGEGFEEVGEEGGAEPPASPAPGVEEQDKQEEEELEQVRGETPEPEIDFREELILFNTWLAKEPYLPKNLDEEILITFLWNSDTVEEAEAKLMNYFYARQAVPQVFHERHPCSPNNLQRYDAVCVVPLTSRTSRKWIVFLTWLAHGDPGKFSPYHQAKLIFTELDILLQENQVRGKTVSVILDMAGYTPQHTDMITRYAARRICYLFTDCFPAKFNGFYVINPPSYIPDYTALFAPFDFHLVTKLEDLAGFLPQKHLTRDLGGPDDALEREELFEPFFKRMRRCGNWLAYEEYQRSRELLLRMTTTREEFGLKS